jgi:hypothetical protein
MGIVSQVLESIIGHYYQLIKQDTESGVLAV